MDSNFSSLVEAIQRRFTIPNDANEVRLEVKELSSRGQPTWQVNDDESLRVLKRKLLRDDEVDVYVVLGVPPTNHVPGQVRPSGKSRANPVDIATAELAEILYGPDQASRNRGWDQECTDLVSDYVYRFIDLRERFEIVLGSARLLTNPIHCFCPDKNCIARKKVWHQGVRIKINSIDNFKGASQRRKKESKCN